MSVFLPYQLTFTERSGYLYARVEALLVTSLTSAAYLREIRAEADRLGLKAVLIDRQIPSVGAVVGLFNIAGNSVPILKGIKTAWLNTFEENQDMLEFATRTANDHGAEYGLFTTEADAEAWLLDLPSRPLPQLRIRSRKVH